MTNQSYYAILGLHESATQDEIQAAFRRLAKEYHPDVSGSDTAGAFREVLQAWETLGDPQRRKEYDERLRRSRQARRRDVSATAAGRRARPPWHELARETAVEEQTLHLELHMSPTESEEGGEVFFELPALERCDLCGELGRSEVSCCPGCFGRGQLIHWQRWVLRVPPGLKHGDVVTLPLSPDVPRYRRLTLHVAIE